MWILNACASVLAVFINRPFKVVASQMSCFIDMYAKCGVYGSFECIEWDALPWYGVLHCNDIWICEMWVIAEGIGNISTNATQRCATRMFDFCGGDTNCIDECSCTWRGQLCSSTDRSMKLWIRFISGKQPCWLVCEMWEHLKMHIEYLMRCPDRIWFLGIPCLEDICLELAMLRKQLKSSGRCAREV